MDSSPENEPRDELPSGQSTAIAILKLFLIGMASCFVFVGTCIPLSLSANSDMSPIALLLAFVFFLVSAYFAVVRRSMLALVIVIIAMIVGFSLLVSFL